MFTVIPAIDVAGGRVVRLTRGQASAMTVYATDPVAVAERFAAAGAQALHVVDLDAAWGDPGLNVALVTRMTRIGPPVQLGGGVRSVDAARRWLDAGVRRLVVGSAIRDADLFAALTAAVGPHRLMASLDFRGDELRIAGWREAAGVTGEEAVRRLRDGGWTNVVVTAVDRDGTGEGPDLALVGRWVGLGFLIYAAGGIRSRTDLDALSRLGARGAVVGRAFYDGSLTVEEGFAC
jgi:phosphoribosylformimino-5-aminoimidazole carboxamide ribotide isomerase